MAHEALREAYKQAWENYRHYSNLRFAAFAGFVALNGGLAFAVFGKTLSLTIPLPLAAGLSWLISLGFGLAEWRIGQLLGFCRQKATELEGRLGLPSLAAPPRAAGWRWATTSFIWGIYALVAIAYTYLWLSPTALGGMSAALAASSSPSNSTLSPSWAMIAPAWITAFATLGLIGGVIFAICQYRHNVRTQKGSFLAELHRRSFGEDPDLFKALYYIDAYHRSYPVLRFQRPSHPGVDKFTFEEFLMDGGGGGRRGGQQGQGGQFSEPQASRPLEWRIDKLLSFFEMLGTLTSPGLNLLKVGDVETLFGYHLVNTLLHPAVYTYIRHLRSLPRVETGLPLEFPHFVRLAKEVIRNQEARGVFHRQIPLMLLATEPVDAQEVKELEKLAHDAMMPLLNAIHCSELFPSDFEESLKDKRILIARTPDDRERLIGYIVFFEGEAEGRRVLYIDQLIIAEEFRRQGYGTGPVQIRTQPVGCSGR